MDSAVEYRIWPDYDPARANWGAPFTTTNEKLALAYVKDGKPVRKYIPGDWLSPLQEDMDEMSKKLPDPPRPLFYSLTLRFATAVERDRTLQFLRSTYEWDIEDPTDAVL